MKFIVEIPGLIGSPEDVAMDIEDLLVGDFDEVNVYPASTLAEALRSNS